MNQSTKVQELWQEMQERMCDHREAGDTIPYPNPSYQKITKEYFTAFAAFAARALPTHDFAEALVEGAPGGQRGDAGPP